ncbi:MAG: c-type cytochrome [Acidobacteria bacterium]|nr:c-type cytochrome [Acidobacteriota bacterium]
MRLALALASFVILLIHGLVFYNQFFHKWENYQTAYFDQARALSKTDAEKAALAARSPRIEQSLVTKFGDMRVDRCVTCHVAMDDPRFDKHAQPLRTHPYSASLGDTLANGKWERRHKFSDFGCTVCHDGQGRGLKEHYSHGEDHYWPDPLAGYIVQANWRKEFQPKLKGKDYMQANCAQCHTEEGFPGTPMVDRGRKLFFASNCYGCHRIDGLSEGTLGPDLSEVGKKFKTDYLWESVVDPRANLATSFMPKFNLSDDDVRAVVIFLKSRRGINFAETSLERYRAALNARKPSAEAGKEPVLAGAALAARGEKLIADRACTACHKLGQRDGGVAPDLSFEGLMKPQQWIEEHFRNPRATIADSIMPTFRFSDADFAAMSAYLAGLKTAPALPTPAETYKTLCQRCHGEKGDGHGTIAIYLDPYPRDLTKAGFINSKTMDRLSNSVKHGVAGTSMPAWGAVLKDDQVRGVLEYVFATYTKEPRKELKPLKAPDSNPVASNADSIRRGEETFVRRCSGCHGRKADGKGPNSLDILPRPRNLRNSAFVNSVSDRRLFESILYGVQGSAMPSWIDYGLSQNDVGDLVNFIRSINAQSSSRSSNARGN